MEADQNGSRHSEDEDFQKHIQQMLKNGPDSKQSSGQPSWQQNSALSAATTTEIDLNGSDSTASRLETSLSLDDGDSPFKPPDVVSGAAGYSPSQSAPQLSSSGAYPRAQEPPTGASKVDQVKAQVKEFTLDTFRTTKQLFSEIMGKGTRTVDPQIDVAIAELRTLQVTYQRLLEETKNLHSYFSNVIYTQKQMTNVFGELAQRDTKLAEDFNYNAETQRVLIKNGEQLLGALNFFQSNMRTMCTKTIQDCLDTVKKYESARLQYDTYRAEHEQTINSGASSSSKSQEIRQKYEERKKKYDQLKSDVQIKMQFLEENKNKVVHRQMILFHNAISAYFTGNQAQLKSVLSQFNIQLKNPNSEQPSWLEK